LVPLLLGSANGLSKDKIPKKEEPPLIVGAGPVDTFLARTGFRSIFPEIARREGTKGQ